jgi:ferredoxin
MPKLTVEGVGTFDVPQGKRLVLALEQDARIDQMHACGGNARCTTCRVTFISGEPPKMTVAEKTVLEARGLTGVRLSCQILAEHDMAVRAESRVSTTPGRHPRQKSHRRPNGHSRGGSRTAPTCTDA